MSLEITCSSSLSKDCHALLGPLLVLEKYDNEVMKLTGPKLLNGRWDLAAVDHGATASVFVFDGSR